MTSRKYNSNLSFVDLLFNLLIGFASLFFLAFLLINPIAEEGKIDPVTQLMVTLRWEDSSKLDMDLWVRGPTQKVGYNMKDGQYLVLERDDLGAANDSYEVDGVIKVVQRNMETVTINDIVPGEYVVTVFYFGGQPTYAASEPTPSPHSGGASPTAAGKGTGYLPQEVEVEILDMHPFKVVLSRKVELMHRQEITIATFVIDEDGNVQDLRTDIKVRLFTRG